MASPARLLAGLSLLAASAPLAAQQSLGVAGFDSQLASSVDLALRAEVDTYLSFGGVGPTQTVETSADGSVLVGTLAQLERVTLDAAGQFGATGEEFVGLIFPNR